MPGRFFSGLRYIVLDELHSLVTSKRGHLLSLGLSRLRRIVPGVQAIGLSATVADPDALRGWLVDQNPPGALADLIAVEGGAKPEISILDSQERVPWAGHSSRYAIAEIYEAIKKHRTTLLFVNTRSQAEMLFSELWRINEDTLPIALHHGSLDVSQRRRVEKAMGTGGLRAIVATSTLDLGIDWGDVDLVVHVGAPKGRKPARPAHRPRQSPARRAEQGDPHSGQPLRGAGVPGRASRPIISARRTRRRWSTARSTCLPSIFSAWPAPRRSTPTNSMARSASAAPYARLSRETFDRAVEFVATGGYALKTYERYAKIRQTKEGRWRISHPRFAQQYRLNVGTIVEAPYLTLRYARSGRGIASRGGPVLGKIEEGFLESIAPGDTFLFAGKVLRLEGIRETEAFVSNAVGNDPRIPIYAGGKFPLSTYLANEVRGMLADPERWKVLPDQVSDWLRIQAEKSVLPRRQDLLVETFPRGERHYMVIYPFEGRLAHQTLGMLLTRRLDRAGMRPLGFVATDYSIAVWALDDMGGLFKSGRLPLSKLFDEDMLGDDLEAWLAESWLLKRTFRNCALISGLIEKRHPGQEKSGRQVTVSADLIYDVLRSHEPDHLLLQATRADAATGLLDVSRLAEMLSRIRGRIVHKHLEHISPLAVPIMLEIGKERVAGGAAETLLEEASLVEEAMGNT